MFFNTKAHIIGGMMIAANRNAGPRSGASTKFIYSESWQLDIEKVLGVLFTLDIPVDFKMCC